MTTTDYHSTPEILIEVQKTQLEILKEFDRICKKHKLKYNIFGGSLLGAIRHSGFIPWDDDIDVSMKREDYNKFLLIAGKELNKNYFLQNINSEDNSPFLFTKIRKNDTLFIEDTYKKVQIHQVLNGN